MSVDRVYRIKIETVEADRSVVTALEKLRDYAPMNPAYSASTLMALSQALNEARQNEFHAQNAFAAARDATIAAEWALHKAVRGVKAQVIAQYGDDSDAVQSLGLKKVSKRKRASSRSS